MHIPLGPEKSALVRFAFEWLSEHLRCEVSVDYMLGQGLYLLRDLDVRILILIHFAELELNFLEGLPEGDDFCGFDVGYDHLTEHIQQLFY